MISWEPKESPQVNTLEGNYCRLEALEHKHSDQLFDAVMMTGAEERFAYLPESVMNREDFDTWMCQKVSSVDPLYFAVIDKKSDVVGGRQTLMRIEPEHGVIEIGHILWSPLIAQTRVSTEAFFLFAQYVFDDLHYRRLEWKCNNANEASKKAAVRFGFTPEGVFRQHLVVKGENRDTAWFSLLDHEWPAVKSAFMSWLEPSNFDETGNQYRSLRSFHETPI